MRWPFIHCEDTPAEEFERRGASVPGPQKRGTGGTLRVIGHGQRDERYPPRSSSPATSSPVRLTGDPLQNIPILGRTMVHIRQRWLVGRQKTTYPTPSPHFLCKYVNIKDLSRDWLILTLENKRLALHGLIAAKTPAAVKESFALMADLRLCSRSGQDQERRCLPAGALRKIRCPFPLRPCNL